MRLDRRSLLALGASGAGASLPPATAIAQPAIPDKAVRLLVGFGTGGGIDLVARQLAPQLERRVGRHVSVENRPGGTGALAGEALRKGPNDGSHLALMPSTTIAARLVSNAYPFDPLVDVAPITTVASFAMAVAVSPRIDVSTFEDYLKWLKGGDGERNRLGTVALSDAFIELFGKMLTRELGTAMSIVGFRNSSGMFNDLESGRLPAVVAAVPSLLSGHRGGRLKILVVTGRTPVRVAPRLPTAAQLGLNGFDLREWYAFFTGGLAPHVAVDAWNGHMRAVIEDAQMKTQLTQLGLDVETSTPEECTGRIADYLRLWKSRLETFGVASVN